MATKKSQPSSKAEAPTNAFSSWPCKPEYTAIALVRKGGMWAVLQLQMKTKEVVHYEVTNETSFEFAIDKAIRKLAQSVRRN